ncbi:hypothetical protein OEB96_34715 [Paraliomyxa miuraensis]|nr:hypothetical protein [Paraliomyxa miuraensis]
MPPRRAGVALMALLMALVGLLWTDWDAVDRGVLRSVIARDLERVDALAGLKVESGSYEGQPSLPVMVVQEGGPSWIREEAEAAVRADDVLTLGEPHLLRVEVIEHARTYGVRCQLWRQGWSLRAPEPLWAGPAPWVVLLSALAGAGWAGLRRRVTGGLLLAGTLAQLLLLALPWPLPFVRPSLVQTWREGPLGHGVVTLARGLPDASMALGAGIITLCTVLMIFDHRRSPQQGGGVVAVGVLGVLGVLAWVEASLRAGLWPWLHQAAGWLAISGALGLWAWAVRGRVRRRAEGLDA